MHSPRPKFGDGGSTKQLASRVVFQHSTTAVIMSFDDCSYYVRSRRLQLLCLSTTAVIMSLLKKERPGSSPIYQGPCGGGMAGRRQWRSYMRGRLCRADPTPDSVSWYVLCTPECVHGCTQAICAYHRIADLAAPCLLEHLLQGEGVPR